MIIGFYNLLKMSNTLFSIQKCIKEDFSPNYNVNCYSIFLFQGKGEFLVDFIPYEFSGNTILFLSPYQNFQWLTDVDSDIELVQFHGDFYCIEYHKKEVACNGLLFNNIYLLPHICVSAEKFVEIKQIIDKLDAENKVCNPFSEAILKSYLQLILALCSKEKNIELQKKDTYKNYSQTTIDFQNLVEKHFLTEKSPSFYADKLALSPNTFSKKIKQQFGKTPTQLIKERVILEAKKLLHLTYKSIKEIAFELHFEDEFYFSRYFKKSVGLSPTHYREQVGISVVAK